MELCETAVLHPVYHIQSQHDDEEEEVVYYEMTSPASNDGMSSSSVVDDATAMVTSWDGCHSDVLMSPLYNYMTSSAVSCRTAAPAAPHHVTSTPAPMLPPCRVCGEKASGFHYGANTCEACKSAAERRLQMYGYSRQLRHTSRQTQHLRRLSLPQVSTRWHVQGRDIGHQTGVRCDKTQCQDYSDLSTGLLYYLLARLQLAIKTGRYTHEKKTRDIQEVKRLQLQQQLLAQGQVEGHCDSVMTDAEADCGAMCVDDDMETLIRDMKTIHEQQTPHTREFFDRLPAKENEYFEQRLLRQDLFGPLKPISHQEYVRIYETTGIDVDGRRDMIKHMIPCIEKAIKRFITSAKALPGFKDLPLDDQIALIKGSRFEAWLLSAHKAFNIKLGVFTHVCGYTLHIDDMSRLYDVSFLQHVFRMADKMQRFHFSTEEECILKGIFVLSRDRCQLQQPDAVEQCQAKLFEMMEYVRSRRRPNERLFTPRLVGLLVELRSLTDMHEHQEGKIGLEWCTDIKIPPLLYELFSV